MPTGSRGASVGADTGQGLGGGHAPRSRRAMRARSARLGSRTTVSTRLFQAPQVRHCPSQRRKASPQVPQT